MHLEVIHEDTHCLVVNKPHNLLIHNSYYARNIKEATLLDILQKTYSTSFYPIHRLDRKTSGILLLAKEKSYVSTFQKMFQSNSILKAYCAIVRGFCEEEMLIESPVKHPETGIYKEATTLIKPIKKVELPIAVQPYDSSRYSFVELIPATGRLHQLRIHMNKISRPVIGDHKYGDRFHNRMIKEQFGCENLFLHARKLVFQHPFSEEKLKLVAPYSSNWKRLFNEFDWDI